MFLKCMPPVVGERGDTKDGVCEALEQVFGQFPKHRLKILLRIVKAMLERKIFSNPQFGTPIYMKLLTMVVLGSRVCFSYTKI
jgi:hypothetical protein